MSTLLPEIKALGTVWWIEIFEDISREKAEAVYDGLGFLITAFENKLSRFKPDSLVGQLNQNHTLTTTDPDFKFLIHKSQRLFLETNGLFNILLGEILENTGYDQNYSFSPKNQPPVFPNLTTDLEIDGDTFKLKQGHLDLGGIGKGYLIDLIAQKLQTEYDLKFFLINGGGDMYATSDHGQPITIYLEHPLDTKKIIKTTTLKNQGFAASSPHKRRWRVSNQTFSHIINPDQPDQVADGSFIKSSTSALEADVFATIALIAPLSDFKLFAQNRHFRWALLFDNAQKSLNLHNFWLQKWSCVRKANLLRLRHYYEFVEFFKLFVLQFLKETVNVNL